FHLLLHTLRPSPLATLFPYTTLFRSGLDLGTGRDCLRQVVQEQRLLRSVNAPRDAEPAPLAAAHRVARTVDRVAEVLRHGVRLRDRKSTRLNSSHGSISYAVFCLKKK